MRARSLTVFIALCVLVFGCKGEKRKTILEKKREAEVAALARLNAKNLKTGRPPRPEMTPEQFNGQMAQAFGDANLPLIDPQGRVFKGLERRWEKDIRFDASNAAWDKPSTTLYGAARNGRDVVTVELKDGAQRTKATRLLRPVPKKVDPKKLAKGEHLQNMEPFFELSKNGLVIAQSVPVKDDLFTNIIGMDPASGKVRWKKRVPNKWSDGFSLWGEGNLALLGDTSTGPIYLFDVTTGAQSVITYPEGETYVYAGTDGVRVAYYHILKNKDLYLLAYDKDAKVVWRRGVSDCYGNNHYLKPFVNGVMPCKAKSTAKEHIDKVLKINYANGQTVWEATAYTRPVDVVKDAQRVDLITMRDGKEGSGVVYFRNRFAFVRVEKDGRIAWTHALDDKEIYLVADGLPFRSENVMAGDEPYDEVRNLDPATGKVLWSYKEEKGLPAKGMIRDNTLAMHGDWEVRILSLSDGKVLLKQRSKERVEGVSVVGGVAHVDTLGVRQAYRLTDGALLMHDKSEDETVVNQWLEMPWAKGLYLYHDEERRISRVQPVGAEQKIAVDPAQVRNAKLLTAPAIEVDRVRWLNATTLEVQSLDDKRAWSLPVGGGAASATGNRRDGVKAGKGGALAYLADPVKVEEKASVKIDAGGKTYLATAFPAGDFAWAHGAAELAFAERRPPTRKSQRIKLADIAVRIWDAASKESRDAFVFRGVDETSTVGSLSFGPGNKTLTVVFENLYGSHYVATVAARGKPLIGDMMLDELDGTVTVKVPKVLAPTKKLGLDQGDQFGEVAWSPDGRVLAYTRGQRLVLLSADGQELLEKPELVVSGMKWSPNGASLIFVKDGNLWRWQGGRIERLTYLLPKREPRNEEEQKNGNLYRISSLEFSPNGKQLAFGLRWPEGGNMRAAVVSLE